MKEQIDPKMGIVIFFSLFSFIGSIIALANGQPVLGVVCFLSTIFTWIFFSVLFNIELRLREIKNKITESKETSINDMTILLKHLKDQDTKNQEDFRHAMKFLHDDLMRIEAKLKDKP